VTAPPHLSDTVSGTGSGPVSQFSEKQLARLDMLAMWLCGASYFVQFLAMAFASFPLQTHLRKLIDPSSASLVAGLVPIATCSAYLIFRLAEWMKWTRFPQRSLVLTALLLSLFQFVLGCQISRVSAGESILGPVLDTGICILLMGCANASCMILLNHIAVATLKQFAYAVRAAGTAGYMVAVLLMGSVWSNAASMEQSHLFIASGISIIHGAMALAGAWFLGNTVQEKVGHSATNASVGIIGQRSEIPATSDRKTTTSRSLQSITTEPDSGPTTSSVQSETLTWWGLLILVWMVAMCEMAYALYSHEFMTELYGTLGYYLFAAGLALEIVLLLLVSRAAAFRSHLLFLGPLGWILLMLGGLLAIGGTPSFGALTLAMALNCPFQMSVSEHVHRIDSRVLGVASVSLAQALGYMSAAGLSALVSHEETGPRNLWLCMIPVGAVAILLSIWKMRRMQSTLKG
jgi:hypothetical protein